MYAIRRWSVRHSRGLNSFYRRFEIVLATLHPLLSRIGYARLERPVAALEKSDQGGALRLQDVWSVCAECHRHVMSDELSEESPKRTMRRRAGGRLLRGPA